MTVKEIFRKELGSKKFNSLPPEWKAHIRRVDSLPTPRVVVRGRDARAGTFVAKTSK